MRIFRDATTGAQLRYIEFSGSGRPLILLHDLGRASSFDFPELSRYPALIGRSLILLDLLGFGYSDKPVDFGYRIRDHSRCVAQFVRHKGYDRLDLFGHGFGGTVALDAAILLGTRVKHLILAAADLDANGTPFNRAVTSMDEAGYVQHGHIATIELAQENGAYGQAVTLKSSLPEAMHRGAHSLVDGGTQDFRQMLYSHPAQKTYIIGCNALPHPATKDLEDRDVRCLVVPKAGENLCDDNLRGLARAICMALNLS